MKERAITRSLITTSVTTSDTTRCYPGMTKREVESFYSKSGMEYITMEETIERYECSIEEFLRIAHVVDKKG